MTEEQFPDNHRKYVCLRIKCQIPLVAVQSLFFPKINTAVSGVRGADEQERLRPVMGFTAGVQITSGSFLRPSGFEKIQPAEKSIG